MNQPVLERVIREKEWHNKTFGTDARTTVSKFYSINSRINLDMDNHILAALMQDKTKFLEYGCGNGYYLINISNKIKQGIGIDISELLIEYAKSKLKEYNIKNIDFFVMDAMDTVFGNEEFDIIHGQSILHHLDLKLCLTEIKRILKDDGKSFFVEPLDTNPVIKLYRKLTPNARTPDEQPLRRRDIKLIKNIFPMTDIYFYSFLTLLAVPFRNKKCFAKILAILFFLDKIILHKRSPLKWLAWTCILVLKK
ncbi:MAG: class I SAM-dependent methyltransferase [Treponema sp.]|jgi:ubiquinone/menaquinone biosynthesis C-methylase UbiE|nr:class I SAM-dependent methyltransferase [Treponema sp.]